MLEIKTLFRTIHRPARPVSEGFTARPGLWAYVGTDGKVNNIATDSMTQHQPSVLKMVINVSTSENYEGHDTKVMRVATLDGIFRAAVDSNGFQMNDTQAVPVAISYPVGTPLTPAYRVTNVGSSEAKYAAAEDIGKLRPAGPGDTVYAYVDGFDGSILTFSAVSPKPYGGDDVWSVSGSGALLKGSSIISGDGIMDILFWRGAGNWNDPSKWSRTVDGPGGAGVPGLNTNVIFDNISSDCTMNGTDGSYGYCKHLDMTGYTNNLIAAGKKLQIHGNASLDGSSDVEMEVHVSGNQTLSQTGTGTSGVKIDAIAKTTNSVLTVLTDLDLAFKASMDVACERADIVVVDGRTITASTFEATGNGLYQLYLRSVAATVWNLIVTTLIGADRLNIANMDAAGGVPVETTNSTDGGGNTNVVFPRIGAGSMVSIASTVAGEGNRTEPVVAGYDIGAYEYTA